MLFIGIDIAKSFHVACILGTDSNKPLKKNLKFNNDNKGFDELLSWILSVNKDISNFKIVMEATGLLFENLYLYLKEKGFDVILLNPYQTNRFREIGMKKVKNDNIDALTIAALIKSNRYAKAYVSEDTYQSIKSLYRHKASLQEEIKKHKRQVSTLLAVVFQR